MSITRGTWDIQIKSGGNWASDGTIYRPNDNLVLNKISTQIKTRLADGDNGFVTPSVKYNDEPIELLWIEVGDETKDKIEGYIESQNDIKIIDHNNVEYIGRFIGIQVDWAEGNSENLYDIRATFEFMPTLA